MRYNLVLTGCGGKSIRDIAGVLTLAAQEKGFFVSHVEVHSHGQQDDSVESHMSLSDTGTPPTLINDNEAQCLIATEPYAAHRLMSKLQKNSAVIANTSANIDTEAHPPIETILGHLSQFPGHLLLDMDHLAQAAGDPNAINMAALGAATLVLPLDRQILGGAVRKYFHDSESPTAHAAARAYRFGLNAALAYEDAIKRGGTSRAIRQWIEQLPAGELDGEAPPKTDGIEAAELRDRLSGAEIRAFENALIRTHSTGRRQLFEHEVYELIDIVGAIAPPIHQFVPKGEKIDAEQLKKFPGNQVVLKLVSPDVVHKSDAGGVAFVSRQADAVQAEIDRMVARHAETADVAGILVVEFVEPEHRGFGSELFVGIRATREFGPVIAAGLGGVDTEYLASKMKPGIAVAKAAAVDTSAEEFFDMFKKTAAYDVLAGNVRGHKRIVSDGDLLRCFRAFIAIARHFCVDRGETGPDIGEMEVNPFAFRNQRLIPLDGRGRMETATKKLPQRPADKVHSLLKPNSVAVVGVSAKSMNFGRIILNNVKQCGFPTDHLYVIKEDADEIDGIRCVPNFDSLPETVDLAVLAAPAHALADLVPAVNNSGKVRSAIMISGGVGETEGTEDLEAVVREAIRKGREQEDGGCVFIGPNSMGVQSYPGNYNTFFIQDEKRRTKWEAQRRRVAIISQSGAFILSTLSNLTTIDPAIAISVGNQMDLTSADLLRAVGQLNDIDVISMYVEGFNDSDGLDFLRAVREVTSVGKEVIFYKAGRTEKGRSAAAGHTASVAGDYDICISAAEHAGAIVAETFAEYQQLLEIATCCHDKKVTGNRVWAMSNAGMETVGMADSIRGPRYEVALNAPSPELHAKLVEVLKKHKLEKLANARNPLDTTAMGREEAFRDIIELMVEADEMDAIIVSFLPMAPGILTTPEEIKDPRALIHVLPKIVAESPKPICLICDAGPLFDDLANAMRLGGVPVFGSCDQAVRTMGRYLCHRANIDVSG